MRTRTKNHPAQGPGDKSKIRPAQEGTPDGRKGLLIIYELGMFLRVHGFPGIFYRLDFYFGIFLGKTVMFFQLA